MSRCKLCSEGSQVPDPSHVGCVLPTSDLNQYLYLGYFPFLYVIFKNSLGFFSLQFKKGSKRDISNLACP